MVLYSSSSSDEDDILIWVDEDEDEDEDDEDDTYFENLHASFQDLARARKQQQAAAAATSANHNDHAATTATTQHQKESSLAELTQTTRDTRASMETQYTFETVPDENENEDENDYYSNHNSTTTTNEDEDLLSTVRSQMQELFLQRKAEAARMRMIQSIALTPTPTTTQQEGDDWIEQEVVEEEYYEEQVIERWFGRDDSLPDDLEGACRKLIPIVYDEDDPHVDPESMIRRTPLEELYRYLKQHYDYKKEVRKNLTQAEQETVEQPTNTTNTPPPSQTSLADMLLAKQRTTISMASTSTTTTTNNTHHLAAEQDPSSTHQWHDSTSTAMYEEISESHNNEDSSENGGLDLVVVVEGRDDKNHRPARTTMTTTTRPPLSPSKGTSPSAILSPSSKDDRSSSSQQWHDSTSTAIYEEISSESQNEDSEDSGFDLVIVNGVVDGQEDDDDDSSSFVHSSSHPRRLEGEDDDGEETVEETIHDDEEESDTVQPLEDDGGPGTTSSTREETAEKNPAGKPPSNVDSKAPEVATTTTSKRSLGKAAETITEESSFSFANLRSKMEDVSTPISPSIQAGTRDGSHSKEHATDHTTTTKASFSFANLRAKLEDKSTTAPTPRSKLEDKSSTVSTSPIQANAVETSLPTDKADHDGTKDSFSFANLRSKLEDMSATVSSPKPAAAATSSASKIAPNDSSKSMAKQETVIGNGVKAQTEGNETSEAFVFGNLRSKWKTSTSDAPSSEANTTKDVIIPPTKSKANSISSLQTRWNNPQLTKNGAGNSASENMTLVDSSAPNKKPAKFKASSVGSIQSRWSNSQNLSRQTDKEVADTSVKHFTESSTHSYEPSEKEQSSNSTPVSPILNWKSRLRKVPETKDDEKRESRTLEPHRPQKKEASWKTSLKSSTTIAANKAQDKASTGTEMDTSEETGSALPNWRMSLKPSQQTLELKQTVKTNDKPTRIGVSSWKSSLKSTQADKNVEATKISEETGKSARGQPSGKASLKSFSTRKGDGLITTSGNTENVDKSAISKRSWKASAPTPGVPPAAKSKPSPAAMWRASQSAASTPWSASGSSETAKDSKVSPSVNPGESSEQSKVAAKTSRSKQWNTNPSSTDRKTQDGGKSVVRSKTSPAAIWKASRAAASGPSAVSPKASPAAIWKASQMAHQSTAGANYVGPHKTTTIEDESKVASSTQEALTKTKTRKWKISPQGNLGKRSVVPPSEKPVPLSGNKSAPKESPPLRSPTKLPGKAEKPTGSPRKPSALGPTAGSERSPSIRPSWLKPDSTSGATSAESSQMSKATLPPEAAPPPVVTSKWGRGLGKQPPPSSPVRLAHDFRSPSSRWTTKTVDPAESFSSPDSDVPKTSNNKGVALAPLKKWKPPGSAAASPTSSKNNRVKQWKPTTIPANNDVEDSSRKSFSKWKPTTTSATKVTSSSDSKFSLETLMGSSTGLSTADASRETEKTSSPVTTNTTNTVVRKWKTTVPTDTNPTVAATAAAPPTLDDDISTTTTNFASLRSKFTPTKMGRAEKDGIATKEPLPNKKPKEEEQPHSFAFSNLQSKFGGT